MVNRSRTARQMHKKLSLAHNFGEVCQNPANDSGRTNDSGKDNDNAPSSISRRTLAWNRNSHVRYFRGDPRCGHSPSVQLKARFTTERSDDFIGGKATAIMAPNDDANSWRQWLRLSAAFRVFEIHPFQRRNELSVPESCSLESPTTISYLLFSYA